MATTKKKRNKPYKPTHDTNQWRLTSTVMFKLNPEVEARGNLQIHHSINQLELCRGTLLNAYDVYLRILTLAMASDEFNEAEEVFTVAKTAIDSMEDWLSGIQPVLGKQDHPLPSPAAERLRLAAIYAEEANRLIPRRQQYLLSKEASDVLARHPILGRHVPWR